MKNRIREYLIDKLSIDETVIKNTKDNDDLTKFGLDSLNVVYLIAELEQEYDFTFDEDDLLLANFDSIEKIETIVNRTMTGE
ncbi:MAG: acyl carrier protein [bacterium]|nr:acyl carrier protein [bacterium]